MRKTNALISTILLALTLASCGSSFEDSQSLDDRALISLSIENTKTTGYLTGDIFKDKVTFTTYAVYSDGTKEEVIPQVKEVTHFASVDGYPLAHDGSVLIAGTYVASIFTKYTNSKSETASYTDNVTVKVDSVFASSIAKNCTGFSAKMNNVIVPEKKIKDQLDLTLTFDWENHGSERVHFDGTALEGVTYKLRVQGSETDVTDQIIQDHTDYVLDVTYNNMLHSFVGFTPELGIKKIDKEDLKVTPKDFNGAYSPVNKGTHNAYIIPLTFHADVEADFDGCFREWNSTSLEQLETAYLNTFVPYYAALGINFTITIGNVYDITEAAWHVEKLLAQDKPFTLLFSVIASVFPKERKLHDSEYWKTYDIDGDGQIDDIHFVGNFVDNQWGTALWPHQSQTFNPNADPEKLVVNSYTYNNFDNATNPNDLTSVHEQGHAFGLLDYYDYTIENGHLSDINYVGNIDMQSSNTYDWNSYSKLSCGLVSPYVVTGYANDCEVTIEPAATSGDCIIVPANYATWNGSAFDEYFLIELFADVGINHQFWNFEEEFGIRIYHVDSRLYNQLTGTEPDADDVENWPNLGIGIGANNSYDYNALGVGSVAEWKDYKQLCLIQKGKEDTFGAHGGTHRRDLTVDDMFYAGDTFAFDEYKHFLSKTGQTVTTMDNGESFPWTISIEAASKTEATIRFTK